MPEVGNNIGSSSADGAGCGLVGHKLEKHSQNYVEYNFIKIGYKCNKNSKLMVNRSLLDLKSWDQEDIKNRTLQIAEWAAITWNYDKL